MNIIRKIFFYLLYSWPANVGDAFYYRSVRCARVKRKIVFRARNHKTVNQINGEEEIKEIKENERNKNDTKQE